MRQDAGDNSVPREISALLSNQRLILRETQRAVTPLGGVAVFEAFLHKLGFVEQLRQHMPIQWQPSSRFSWRYWREPDALLTPTGYAGIEPCMFCWACPAFPLTTPSAISSAVLAWATCIVSSTPYRSGKWNVYRNAAAVTAWTWIPLSSNAMATSKAR